MAQHANVFEKLSKSTPTGNQPQETTVDFKLIETVKLLGKQIIEIREIIENQNSIIESMTTEIVSLRKKQNEASGNINLAMIDQKDLAKQFRILKATVTGEQLANNRQANNPDEIAKKFYRNYDNSQLFSAPEAANQEAYSWGGSNANSNARLQQQALKQNRMPQIQALPDTELSRSMQTENIAKEFIFGRIPKLLNLE